MKRLLQKPKTTNNTGINGVSISAGSCHAIISNNRGKKLTCKFSINKYGEDEALRLATKWRRERELEIYGDTQISESLIRVEGKHVLSLKRAKVAAEKKRRTALKERVRKEKDLAKKRIEYQKYAGKYIYRIDDLEKGHGWHLSIKTGHKVIADVVFRDSVYYGPWKALKAAQNERSKISEEFTFPLAEGRRYEKKRRASNKTGVTGVCKLESSFIAYIPIEPKKLLKRKFSLNKYGEALAFQLAVEWRRDKELEVYGGTILTDERIKNVIQSKFGTT